MYEENVLTIMGKSLFCVESTIYHSFKLILTHFISTEIENTIYWNK